MEIERIVVKGKQELLMRLMHLEEMNTFRHSFINALRNIELEHDRLWTFSPSMKHEEVPNDKVFVIVILNSQQERPEAG